MSAPEHQTIAVRVAGGAGAFVPAAMILDPKLRGELRLYCLLRANAAERTTYRHRDEIAEALGVSPATFYRWRSSLEQSRWLRTQEVPVFGGVKVQIEVAGEQPFAEVEETKVEEQAGIVFLTSESADSQNCESHSIYPPPPPPLIDTSFSEFWEIWPVRKARAKARTAWTKALTKTDAETILAAVRLQLPALVKSKAEGFGVHATTWLNQERWEDEVEGVTVQAEVGAEWVALADRLAPPWRVGRNDEAILEAVALREGWTAEELENRLSYFVEFYEALDWPLPSLAKVLTAPEGKLTDRYLEGLQADAKRPKRGRA